MTEGRQLSPVDAGPISKSTPERECSGCQSGNKSQTARLEDSPGQQVDKKQGSEAPEESHFVVNEQRVESAEPADQSHHEMSSREWVGVHHVREGVEIIDRGMQHRRQTAHHPCMVLIVVAEEWCTFEV